MRRVEEIWNNFYNHRYLLQLLVTRDIKIKYRRSFLGYIWSVLNPLLTMLVMWLVFSHLFRFDIPNFPVYLLTGQVMFGFMSEATNMSMGAIIANTGLLKKTYVPKYIFPLSRVTSSLVNLLFSLAALLIVIVFTGVPLTFRMLLFVFPVLELYIFCLGLGLFLAQSNVFFRDTQYLWTVIITAWTYVTPIFYPITIMPEWLQRVIKIVNPMYSYIAQFRDLVLYDTFTHFKFVAYGVFWAVAMMVLGTRSFKKNQDRFILYI